MKMAERGGFEPPIRLLSVYRFSKPAPSATRPSLRAAQEDTAARSPSSHCLHSPHPTFLFSEDSKTDRSSTGTDQSGANPSGSTGISPVLPTLSPWDV